MNFKFDGNEMFRDALDSLQSGAAPWVIFGLIALCMAPWLIPAVSKAIAEHRALSHKREQNLLKIRNSAADRAKRPQRNPPTKRS